MASTGFPGREFGFGLPEAGGGGLLKRPLSEMERLQLQQQMQQAMFFRSVKQRTLLASSVPPHLSTPPPQDLFLGASSSLASMNLTASGSLRCQEAPFSARAAEIGPSTTLRDGLQELERRLLLDDEEEDAVSAAGSAVTTAEWSEAMQQLIAAPATVPALSGANQLSPSPTNSSSSTVSSSASSSPPASLGTATPSGASLRQMLLDTANAVADGNSDMATANLAVLKSAANYRGDPEQRLTAMMVAVLFARLKPAPAAGSFPTVAEVCGADHLAASQMLYEVSPCFKLGLMAANLAILEATKDLPKIHILDFEVGHGGQYVALIHALVDRHRLRPAGCPPSLRITAIADPASPFTNNHTNGTLRTVGERIEKLGERHGLSVHFDVVHHRAAELDAAALGCEAGEALAVNLAFSFARIPDESVSPTNPRDELLRRLRALGPRVVALVEQEINTNTAAFAGRFAAACAHYGALLESLDATAARDSGDRGRIEAGLARRAVNSVAREGGDRVERCEVFGKWRARMGMAGFNPVQLRPALVESVKNRLESMRPNPSFSIAEEANRIGFAWKGQILTSFFPRLSDGDWLAYRLHHHRSTTDACSSSTLPPPCQLIRSSHHLLPLLAPWRPSPVDSSQCRKLRSSCLNQVCQGHRNNIGVHTDTEGVEDLVPDVIFLEFEDWRNETERSRRILPDTTGPREGRRSFASSSGGPEQGLGVSIWLFQNVCPELEVPVV